MTNKFVVVSRYVQEGKKAITHTYGTFQSRAEASKTVKELTTDVRMQQGSLSVSICKILIVT